MDNELCIIKGEKLRVICIEDDGACDFTVLENVEKPVDEICDFVKEKYYLHRDKGAKWLVLPCSN